MVALTRSDTAIAVAARGMLITVPPRSAPRA